MNWTHEIAKAPAPEGDTSQNGETGPLLLILEKLGILDTPSMLLVEFRRGRWSGSKQFQAIDRPWLECPSI